ncbi:copper chaperone PCu(A)C [Actinomadura logoneensis]|uniref:Copper chaperone PCu(A)C n=1 Tax=Actinomadura logoneensis TaxID=2293572 RepID=A0A372JDA5_9ACTN|nr:SCO family protein [Actinomadura logoneensis]RFU37987.1 copper chaperone PCu(A)C [Actinomadura logoneensis]
MRAIVALGLAGVLLGAAACSGTSGSEAPAAAERPAAKGPYKSTPLPASYKIPGVRLTDQDGRPYDLAARSKGKVTMLFFGYTHCPDICPTTMADAAGAMSLLSPAEKARTQVLFVTADPARDKPKALKDFLGRFDPSFVGLTGPYAEIKKAAADARTSISPPPTNAEGNYAVQHGSNVMVYKPDGSGGLLFPYQFGSADMAHDLKALLAASSAPGSSPAPAAGTADSIKVTGAQVRVPSSPDVTAGYMTITNTGRPDTLTGVDSPAAASVEMHRMVMNGANGMKMEQIMSVPIGKGTVEFAKGSLHLMLMKPKGLKLGQDVPLTLHFAGAGDVAVTAKVVPVNG